MATRVLITVDTELTWGPYSRGASWEENLARSCDPAGVGISYQLDMLRAHALKACFFVDPMPALVYGIEPVRRMVEPILAAGQEVQLHAHPVWLSVAEGQAAGADFELTCFDAERQQSVIATARDLLIEAGAPPPIAFRSGSFAADAHTLQALRNLGFRYDSSHNASEHPVPSNLAVPIRRIAPLELNGVIEIPVTQIEALPNVLRPLQLCAVSTRELREALRHADSNDHPTTTIVSHGFEFASRDGRRPNRTVQGRFGALCAFLDARRDTLPTAHFTDLEGMKLDAAAAPLPARRVRTAERMVQQLWSNIVYERRL